MKCPKCASENTEFYGTEARDSIYKCNDCGEKWFPHMEFFKSLKGLNQKVFGDLPFSPASLVCPSLKLSNTSEQRRREKNNEF